MKVFGILLIVGSAASFGFRYGRNVRRRVDLIGQLLLAMRLLKGEISVYRTALPQAFGVLAAATHGSAAAYFSQAAKDMNKNPFLSPQTALLTAAGNLKELSNDDPVRRILSDFSVGLGKYDPELQLGSIDRTVTTLEKVLSDAEAEKGPKCKTYRSLGICAGIALAILLL